MPSVVQAETEFDIKTGYFMPTDNAMDDMYGTGAVIAGDLIYWFDNLGMGIGLDYWKQDGTPVTIMDGSISVLEASSEMEIVSLTLTALYRFNPTQKVKPYVGAGLGSYYAKENSSVTTNYSTTSFSGSDTALGVHILAGVDMELSESISFFLEAKLSGATVDASGGLGGEDADIGGFTIFAGIRF